MQKKANNAAKSCICYYWKFQQCFHALREKANKNLQNWNNLLQNELWAWFLTQQEVMCVTVNKYNLVLTHRYLIFFSLSLHFVGSSFLFCCPKHHDQHFTIEHLKKASMRDRNREWVKEREWPQGGRRRLPLPLLPRTAQEGLVQCCGSCGSRARQWRDRSVGKDEKIWGRWRSDGRVCGSWWKV